jgi:hypothetical protein
MDGPKSAIALLTQKPWTPVSYGYDDNQDGSIDGFEESITDCEKDDHYGFGIDGSGFFDDKNISCGNGISEMPFTWRFINEETLVFLFEPVKIPGLATRNLSCTVMHKIKTAV